MFRIITGIPGSGKSYYAVNYLRKFVEYDKLYDSMTMDKDILVVSNIENLKVQHMKIEEFSELGLFNLENYKKHMFEYRFKRMIFIIDEAQRIFSNIRDNELFYFFEYHRHLGIDILLILQTVASIPRRLTELAEYVIEAMPRSYAIVGFRYKIKDSKTGEVLYTSMMKKDLTVFRLYKSFETDEMEKPKQVVLRKYVMGIGIVSAGLLMAIYLLTSNGLGTKAMSANAKEINIKEIKKDEYTMDNKSSYESINKKIDQHNMVQKKDDQNNETIKTERTEREKLVPDYAIIERPEDGKPVVPNEICKGYLDHKGTRYLIYK